MSTLRCPEKESKVNEGGIGTYSYTSRLHILNVTCLQSTVKEFNILTWASIYFIFFCILSFPQLLPHIFSSIFFLLLLCPSPFFSFFPILYFLSFPPPLLYNVSAFPFNVSLSFPQLLCAFYRPAQ